MSDSSKVTTIGITLIFATIISVMGIQILTASNIVTGIQIQNDSTWNQYGQTLQSIEVDNNRISLQNGEAQGSYTSTQISSPVEYVNIETNISNPGKQNVTLLIDGEEYVLSDGDNRISLNQKLENYNFEIQMERGSVQG